MMPRVVVLLAGLLVLGTGQLAAQGTGRALDVEGRRDLDFGTMIAGVPASVPPIAGGFFRVRGQRQAELQLQFTLPASLDGPGGSAPLSFSTTDGAHGMTPATGSAQVFDPRLPLTIVLSNSGSYYVWVGGTVSPPGQLARGTYTATIALTATYTGN